MCIYYIYIYIHPRDLGKSFNLVPCGYVLQKHGRCCRHDMVTSDITATTKNKKRQHLALKLLKFQGCSSGTNKCAKLKRMRTQMGAQISP